MKNYEFTLVLRGVDEETEGLEDSIYEAGCDDCLINFKNGTVYLDFIREAHDLNEAITSAVNEIESCLPAQVISVTPDNLVSESEIAKRIEKGRQTVSLWATRSRNKANPFPSPVLGLSSKRPLWRWYEVLNWLYQQNLVDKQLVDEAEILEGFNAALLERNPVVKKHRDNALKAISPKYH